ncbi:MAG: SRPBCC family protein [Myxococcota bacterium]
MIEFTSALTVRRPLADVFAFWANPDNIPRWQSGVIGYRRETADPIGVGTVYVVTRKALGRQTETRGELTRFEEHQRVVESVKAGPASFTIDTRFAAVDAATTRVTVETRIELGGLLGKIGERMAGRPIRKQAENDHDKIKQILERT